MTTFATMLKHLDQKIQGLRRLACHMCVLQMNAHLMEMTHNLSGPNLQFRHRFPRVLPQLAAYLKFTGTAFGIQWTFLLRPIVACHAADHRARSELRQVEQ